MTNIVIRRQHCLGKDECRRRVEHIAEGLQDQLNGSWSWNGEALHFKRAGASGSVHISDDAIEFHVKLGMLLSPLKGAIEKEILLQADRELG